LGPGLCRAPALDRTADALHDNSPANTAGVRTMPLTDDQTAEWLETQLTQLVDKLKKLARTRLTQHNALLGVNERSHNWQGSKRRTFESEFKHQQDAFIALEAAARTLQRTVSAALAEARKAHKIHD
jgi:hypothetical protein